MGGRELDFGGRRDHVVLRCAAGGRDGAAGRGEGALGPFGRRGPAAARGEDDALAEERGVAFWAGGFHDAAAVGKERVLEGDPRVQVLALEVVSVVECGGFEADEKLAGPRDGLGVVV